eukprot:TRINITY_DN14191_c0_g1_i2.p1 TRINITY_DN14191_c0_g1~~TRINITY_DN14191_c0_g1_i2.p1  ORF type:complete len:241 (-),score=37.59 TRINITY_DN14191_c0_g1_i2:109-831(-)
MSGKRVSDGSWIDGVESVQPITAQIASYGVDEELFTPSSLRKVSSWHAGFEPLEEACAKYCGTPLLQMSTAPCTPPFSPSVGLPQAMLDHVGVDGQAHEFCRVPSSEFQSTRGSESSSEGAFEAMPDTDDEFDAPIEAKINSSPCLVMFASSVPLRFVAPSIFREEHPVTPFSEWTDAQVAAETCAAVGMHAFDPKLGENGSPSFTPTTLRELVCDHEEDESNIFFKSISLSDFLAAYEP